MDPLITRGRTTIPQHQHQYSNGKQTRQTNLRDPVRISCASAQCACAYTHSPHVPCRLARWSGHSHHAGGLSKTLQAVRQRVAPRCVPHHARTRRRGWRRPHQRAPHRPAEPALQSQLHRWRPKPALLPRPTQPAQSPRPGAPTSVPQSPARSPTAAPAPAGSEPLASDSAPRWCVSRCPLWRSPPPRAPPSPRPVLPRASRGSRCCSRRERRSRPRESSLA